MRTALTLAVLFVASPLGAQEPAASAWRVAAESAVAVAGEGGHPYLGGTASVERRGVRGLWFGGRAGGATGPVFSDIDCFAATCPRIEDGWAFAEATAAAEAASGGMAIRASVGVGGAYMLDGDRDGLVPQVSGGVGLDLYPVRAVGFGVRVDGVARARGAGAVVSTGLRVRLGG